ncbi:MAG TPA: hypothetical protein HA340_05260, partial [Candidatus Thalassarchaeaceae archaeon]
MNRFENGSGSLSGGPVLMIIAIMLCSVLSAGISVFATPAAGELDDTPSFAGAKAAGDWVKAGVSDSSTQNGGVPATSASYTDSNGNTFLTGWALADVAFGSNKVSTTAQLVYVAKIDSSGNWVMAESGGNYGGGGFSLGTDIV